jgi:glycerate 2-kinase
MQTPADIVTNLWTAGVTAVAGFSATKTALMHSGQRPDQIIAVGKAAGAMAQAALDHFGPVPTLVVTKDGHGAGLPETVQLIESAHPVPDKRSLIAGQALRETVSKMAAGSKLLVLVSGGASSLAEDPVDGYTLGDLIALNQQLLATGLDIGAMNVQRRKFSQIKGGGLLAGFGGRSVQVLAISDVPGDDLGVIGSGIGDAPQSPAFAFDAQIIASNAHARAASVSAAQSDGLTVLANDEMLHDDLETLAPTIGTRLRDMAPGVMVLGGEPTVILPPNPGQGGRNQALALSLAREIAGTTGITVLVAGTDGSDGPTDAAGAIVDGATWGDGAEAALKRADSGRYLDRKGALLRTGPTGTNVMDLLIAYRD